MLSPQSKANTPESEEATEGSNFVFNVVFFVLALQRAFQKSLHRLLFEEQRKQAIAATNSPSSSQQEETTATAAGAESYNSKAGLQFVPWPSQSLYDSHIVPEATTSSSSASSGAVENCFINRTPQLEELEGDGKNKNQQQQQQQQDQQQQKREEYISVFIGCLPRYTPEAQIIFLVKVCSNVNVRKARFVYNKQGKTSGSAIVRVRNQEEAWKVIASMHRRILIDEAGFWYAENETSMRLLENYCDVLKRFDHIRFQSRPFALTTVTLADPKHVKKQHQLKQQQQQVQQQQQQQQGYHGFYEDTYAPLCPLCRPTRDKFTDNSFLKKYLMTLVPQFLSGNNKNNNNGEYETIHVHSHPDAYNVAESTTTTEEEENEEEQDQQQQQQQQEEGEVMMKKNSYQRNTKKTNPALVFVQVEEKHLEKVNNASKAHFNMYASQLLRNVFYCRLHQNQSWLVEQQFQQHQHQQEMLQHQHQIQMLQRENQILMNQNNQQQQQQHHHHHQQYPHYYQQQQFQHRRHPQPHQQQYHYQQHQQQQQQQQEVPGGYTLDLTMPSSSSSHSALQQQPNQQQNVQQQQQHHHSSYDLQPLFHSGASFIPSSSSSARPPFTQ